MRGWAVGIVLPFLLAPAAVWGEVIVNANILTSVEWTAAAGPYIIEKTVVEVKNGSTLTIGPGVEVRFQPGRTIETLAGSSIVAIGAAGDSIRFTSNNLSPTEGDWTSVHVYASVGSEFRYCVFTYGQYALKLTASDVSVTQCAFRDCSVGAYVFDHSAGTISRSSFWGCGYGLWIWNASPVVETSWIAGSAEVGIRCVFDESLPVIWNCNLVDNGGYNIQLDSYGEEVTVTARENWWGSANESTIQGSIRDAADGYGDGTVDYSDFLSDVPVEAASWGAIKALFKY